MINLKKIEIKNTDFDNIILSGLTSFTVFLGQNNSGKTFLLDLIYGKNSKSTNYISIDEIIYVFSDREIGVSTKIKKMRKLAFKDLIFRFNQADSTSKKLIFRYMKALTGIELDYHQSSFNHFIEKRANKKYHLDLNEIGSAYLALFASLVYMLWNNNPIIIIDEPELGLHAQMQKKYLSVLKSISKLPNKQIFIATHSHLFLDRKRPQNNYKIKNIDGFKSIRQLKNANDIYIVTYQMLGNSPSDLFMPSNFIIVEGPSDKIFIVKLMQRFYSEQVGDKNIIVQPSSGDVTNKQVPKTLYSIEKLFTVLDNNAMYQDRAMILVDQQPVDVLRKFKQRYHLPKDRLRSLGEIKKYALENSYPLSTLKRLAKKRHMRSTQKDLLGLIKSILRNKKHKKTEWARLVGDEIYFDEVPQIFKDVIENAIKLSL